MLIADHQLFREANRVRAGDDHAPVVIVGAGPAGLTAAHECLKLVPASAPLVLEGSGKVGGIARTEEYKGYRFDIGGPASSPRSRQCQHFGERFLAQI